MSTNQAQATFVERLERHRGVLVKVASAYCRNIAAREDLIQEISAALWRAYPRFDGRAAFSTWMYRIAVNVAISFHRSQTHKMGNLELADRTTIEALAMREEPEESDALATLREFIERLDDLDRALMILYLDDNPYAEIAAILGISQSNVATKIARIKQRLKAAVAAGDAA